MAWTDAGLNFRKSSTFVANTTLTTHAIDVLDTGGSGDTELYPVSRTLQGSAEQMTFGNNTASVSNITCRDRNSGNDARLAGFWQNVAAQADIRIDLASGPGTYRLHIARGEANYARSNMYLQILDNTTLLDTLDHSTTSANKFVDATGAEFTQLTFFANETAKSYTFATSTLILRLGDNASKVCYIAHIRIELVAGDALMAGSIF